MQTHSMAIWVKLWYASLKKEELKLFFCFAWADLQLLIYTVYLYIKFPNMYNLVLN